jgi:hypothetical protein
MVFDLNIVSIRQLINKVSSGVGSCDLRTDIMV